MPVIPLVARRLLSLFGVLFIVSLITFLMSNVIPGDPAQMISGPRATAEQVEIVRERLGLDRPLHVQYARYLAAVSHGNLGTSIVTGRPVITEMLSRLPATVEVMLLAIMFSGLFGVLLGTLAAIRRGSVGTLLKGLSIIGISTPVFWLALLLLLLFYSRLGWLPAGGRLDALTAPPPFLTGLYLVDAAAAGRFAILADAAAHLILPVATLTIASVGVYIRVLSDTMQQALSEDYVRTAYANGLSRREVVISHVLPNSMGPFITLFGIELGHLLFGSVIVETIFSWPGLGSYVLNAVMELDFPVIMGFTLMSSFFYVVANLVVDLVLMRLDPRISGVG